MRAVEGKKTVQIVAERYGKGRTAVVLRRISDRSPGRVTWSVILQAKGLAMLDTAASGLRTLREALTIAEAFTAEGGAS
jgi:hypothetical protein